MSWLAQSHGKTTVRTRLETSQRRRTVSLEALNLRLGMHQGSAACRLHVRSATCVQPDMALAVLRPACTHGNGLFFIYALLLLGHSRAGPHETSAGCRHCAAAECGGIEQNLMLAGAGSSGEGFHGVVRDVLGVLQHLLHACSTTSYLSCQQDQRQTCWTFALSPETDDCLGLHGGSETSMLM